MTILFIVPIFDRMQSKLFLDQSKFHHQELAIFILRLQKVKKECLVQSNTGLDYSSAGDLIFTLFNDLSTGPSTVRRIGQMMTIIGQSRLNEGLVNNNRVCRPKSPLRILFNVRTRPIDSGSQIETAFQQARTTVSVFHIALQQFM